MCAAFHPAAGMGNGVSGSSESEATSAWCGRALDWVKASLVDMHCLQENLNLVEVGFRLFVSLLFCQFCDWVVCILPLICSALVSSGRSSMCCSPIPAARPFARHPRARSQLFPQPEHTKKYWTRLPLGGYLGLDLQAERLAKTEAAWEHAGRPYPAQLLAADLSKQPIRGKVKEPQKYQVAVCFSKCNLQRLCGQ